jgi:tRNA (guanine37-N1)-methyltransferase
MSGFDLLGSKEKSVAIVEIAEEDESREKEIAEEIMRKNKNVRAVLKKGSARKGEYRTRTYKLLAGDRDTEILHKEHGYSLKVDPQKAYFSVREGTERQRIAAQVKKGEIVMLMFAGVGPYAIAIGKRQPEVGKIIAVETNPAAVEYMRTNIRINKLSHKITPVLGDVKKVCGKWYEKCNRIIMPLPLGAEEFLDDAIKCSKSGAVVYFYTSGDKDNLYESGEKAIDEKLKKADRAYKIMNRRVVLPYSPGCYKVCIEFKIL